MKGFALGAADFISKPFHEEEVLARVRAHLAAQGLQKRLQEENLRFQSLENATSEGLIFHEVGRILDANDAFCKMFGFQVSEGTVRRDFFHRLHVIALEMSPLRLRKADLPLLNEHFLARYAATGKEVPVIPEEIVSRLYNYEWPGNVRELYNELRRYLATGEIELGDSTPENAGSSEMLSFLQDGMPLSAAVDAFEAFYIERVLQQYDGHRADTAKTLNVGRKALYNKLQKLEL